MASVEAAALAGCRCARCGGTDLALTQTWVGRGLQTKTGFIVLGVRLARCLSCGSRERILPSNALPGKTNDAGKVFSALASIDRGDDIAEVARTHDVSRAGLRKWLRGAAHRYLDLAVLYRHRAMIAPPREPPERLLVRFWVWVSRLSPARTPAALSAASPEEREERDAVHALIVLLEEWGGALAVAQRGATICAQAVLLFRGGGVDTPSSMAAAPSVWDSAGSPDGREETRSQGDRPLALRADRGSTRRGPARRGTGGDPAPDLSRTRALALGDHEEDLARDTLPLAAELLARRARGPPAEAAQ
jgi:transposase-like protein